MSADTKPMQSGKRKGDMFPWPDRKYTYIRSRVLLPQKSSCVSCLTPRRRPSSRPKAAIILARTNWPLGKHAQHASTTGVLRAHSGTRPHKAQATKQIVFLGRAPPLTKLRHLAEAFLSADDGNSLPVSPNGAACGDVRRARVSCEAQAGRASAVES